MESDPPRSHLSRISTPWTLVRLAHADAEAPAAHALRLLLQRYCGAAYRYLRGALRDEDAALDLLQEFVLRFLRGDFRRADPAALPAALAPLLDAQGQLRSFPHRHDTDGFFAARLERRT